MKRFLLILFLTVGFSFTIYGQSDDNTSWMSPSRDRNFYDIQADFNDYWQGKNITPESPREDRMGWKQFKRWEYFWEQRVQPTGKFPAVGHVYREYLKHRAKKDKAKSEKTQASTTWTHLGPKTATGGYSGLGRLNCVVEDPNYNGSTNKTIWVGAASGGIWKTTDAGANWTTNTDELAVLGIGDIVIDPNDTDIMYVATGDGDASDTYSVGVLKSTDGGDNWNTTGFQRDVNNRWVCRRMVMNHSNSNILIVATNGGLYRTTDAGSSWTQEESGDGYKFYDVKQHPTDSSIFYAVTNDDFYRSEDAGDTWTLVTSGVPASSRRFALAVTPAEPDYVYILSTNYSSGYQGVYRSTDAGKNFTTRSTTPNILSSSSTGSGSGGQGWYDLAIAVNPTDADEVFVGGVNMWKSEDGGATWTINSYWHGGTGITEVHADHHMMYFPNAARCYTANDGGLDISTDSGDSWSFIGSGLHITQFYEISIAQTSKDVVLCGAQDNSSYLKTATSFSMGLSTGDGMDQAINPLRGDTMITSSYYGNMYRSFNGGSLWYTITRPEGGGWVTPYVMDPNNPSNVIAGYAGVWKSTSDGSNWTKISTFTNSSKLSSIHVARANSDYIYAGHSSTLWRTTNGGTTWETISLPLSALTHVTTNDSDPNEIWISMSGYNSTQKVYHSTNGGTTWTNISGSLPNVPCNVVLYQHGTDDRVWVGTDIGVWYRGDDDNDWVEYNTGLPNVICNDLEIYEAGDLLRVGTYGRGLWEVDLPESSDDAPKLISPKNNQLQVDVRDELDWETLAGANSYDLMIATDLEFSNIIKDTNLTTNSYDLVGALLDSATRYFWKVRAIKSADTTYWSMTWKFKTLGIDIPILSSPANNATNLERNIMFEWEAVSGADRYQIQISKLQNFSTLIVNDSNITEKYYAAGLDYGTKYYWRVRAKYNDLASYWSVVRNFTTLLDKGYCYKLEESFEGAAIPTGWSETYVSETTNWQFDQADAQEGYKSTRFYHEGHGAVTKLITPLISLGDCTDTLTLEFYHKQKIWGADQDKMKVYYQLDGESNWNLIANYTGNIPDWTKREINISQITDDFKIAFEGYGEYGFGAYLDNVAVYAKPPQYCGASTTYEEEYISNFIFGSINKTSLWQGKVADYSALSTDIVQGSAYGVTVNINVSYPGDDIGVWVDWNKDYDFADAGEFFDLTKNPLNNKQFVGTITVPSGAELGKTRLRVRLQRLSGNPLTACGISDYGEVEEYSVEVKLAAPTLVSPANNATDQEIDITIDWSDVQNADSYDVQLAEDMAFTTLVTDVNTANSQYNVSGLNFEDTYFWRIRAKKGAHVSEWSSVFTFDTRVKLAKAVLTSPVNGFMNAPTDITFYWQSVLGATSYEVNVSKSPSFAVLSHDDVVATTDVNFTGFEFATTYYWRVRAREGGDFGEWSSAFSFKVKSQLSPPNLLSPADNAVGQDKDITLAWSSVAGAAKYKLQVATNSSFSNLVVSEYLTSTSRLVNGLNNNDTYYWRVLSNDGSDDSQWSVTRTFNTKVASPVLIMPADNASNVARTFTYYWMSVQGASKYQIMVSKDVNFATIIIDEESTTTNYALLNSLEYGTQYHWRVRAYGNGAYGDWSAVRAFTVKSRPLPPTLLTPADAATNINPNVTLDWAMLIWASEYELYVEEATTSTVVYHDSLAADEKAFTLDEDTAYEWKVRANDGTDWTEWSNAFTFATGRFLDAPILQSPADNSTNQQLSLTLTWNSVSGATSYTLQVSTQSNFATTIISESMATLNKTVMLDFGTQYYWRVKASAGGHESYWSDVWSLTTKSQLDGPALLAPVDNAIEQDFNITFSWSPVAGATEYQLQVSENSGFTKLFSDISTSSTSKAISGLDPVTDYYWRVRATDGTDYGLWSSQRHFETKAKTPDPVPVSWDFVSNTGKKHSISIASSITAEIGDRDFVNGDAIGFFYDDAGTMKCAGYALWNGSNLSFYIWGDDPATPEKDGYDDSENLTMKIWDAQMSIEYDADFTINSGPSIFTYNSLTVIGSLSAIVSHTIDISLSTSWNIISSNIEPNNTSIASIFNSIKDDILIVKNGDGNTYVPSLGIDQIGTWVIEEGYRVYSKKAQTLSIEGELIDPTTTPVNLDARWNLVAYLRSTSQDISTALDGITDNDNLLIAKDEDGFLFVPSLGIDQIGNLQTGRGYQMYLFTADQLYYPANGIPKMRTRNWGDTPIPKVLLPQSTRTGSDMTLIIEGNFADGTEVGVYSERGKLLGSGAMKGGKSAMTIWGDDEYTEITDGAIDNEMLSLKVTSKSGLADVEATYYDMSSHSVQQTLAYKQSQIIHAQIANPALEKAMIELMPNPAVDELRVKVIDFADAKAYKVYDIAGRVVISGDMISSMFTLDVSSISSGEYIIHISDGSHTIYGKFIKAE